jgi:hypothetical protein
VLGRDLPAGVVIHHVDGNIKNNAKSNLVICEDDSYHKLLHARLRALQATGDPKKRQCAYCKEWDSMENMTPFYARGYHKRCAAAYQAGLKSKRKVAL